MDETTIVEFSVTAVFSASSGARPDLRSARSVMNEKELHLRASCSAAAQDRAMAG